MEVRAGETYHLRLSRKLGEDFPGTGTGAGSTKLHLRADAAACRVNVLAFDP
jgi:hypothetical protein